MKGFWACHWKIVYLDKKRKEKERDLAHWYFMVVRVHRIFHDHLEYEFLEGVCLIVPEQLKSEQLATWDSYR